MNGAGGKDQSTEVGIVKELTRQAAELAGGQKQLGALIRQPRVSELGSDRHPDKILRITEAALFDRLTHGKPGGAHFARYLADNIGCALIPLPSPDLPQTIWGQFIGQVLQEVGELSAGLGMDLADDNDVSPAEAKKRVADAEQMVAAAVQIHEALKRRAEGLF